MSAVYAHTLPGRPQAEWQPLTAHLTGVAKLAAEFARPFGAESWGRAAGLWHDLGKFSDVFQAYLTNSASKDLHQAEVQGRVDHSTAGAQYAVEAIDILGHLLAYAIAGHHSGLPDGYSSGACLDRRLRKEVRPWRHGLEGLARTGPPELPQFLRGAFGRHDGFAIAFFVRMVFSCLVDADFLNTETFMDPKHGTARADWPDDVLQRMDSGVGGIHQQTRAA